MVRRVKRSPVLEKRGSGTLKGLIVSDGSEANLWKKYRKHFKWSYNYGDTTHKGSGGSNPTLLSGVQFAPMHPKSISKSKWRSLAKKAIKRGARILLGWNEPNQYGQSGKEGAKIWKRDMLPLLKKYPHIKGIAPGVSGCKAGLKYLKDFRKNCSNCHVYAYAFHIYNNKKRHVHAGISKLKSWVSDVEKAVGSGKKLWVTEFGNRNKSQSQQISYLKKAVKFFRGRKSIKAFSAFSHLSSGPMVKHNKLTKLGRAYGSI